MIQVNNIEKKVRMPYKTPLQFCVEIDLFYKIELFFQAQAMEIFLLESIEDYVIVLEEKHRITTLNLQLPITIQHTGRKLTQIFFFLRCN